MSALIFIIIGIILMIVELLVMDFTFVFFGLGFLFVGILSFIFTLSWEVQILTAFILSFILLLTLKKHIKTRFLKPKEPYKDNFLDESGKGVVKEGMVYYKGTLWQSDEISGLKNGDKVEVLGVEDGKIILKNGEISSQTKENAKDVNE